MIRLIIKFFILLLLAFLSTLAQADEVITQEWLDKNDACVYGVKWAQDNALGLTIEQASEKLLKDEKMTNIEKYHFIHWAIGGIYK